MKANIWILYLKQNTFKTCLCRARLFLDSLFTLFYFTLCVWVLVSTCLCTLCLPGAGGGHPRASDPLQLEFLMAVSLHVDAGIELILFKKNKCSEPQSHLPSLCRVRILKSNRYLFFFFFIKTFVPGWKHLVPWTISEKLINLDIWWCPRKHLSLPNTWVNTILPDRMTLRQRGS